MDHKDMEVWQDLDLLFGKQKHRLFGKDNTADKLVALENLAKNAPPSYIVDLVGLLEDANETIRTAVCKTITKLLAKINGKNNHYETLRHCGISIEKLERFKIGFKKEDYVVLIIIASMNHNGYVREKAVSELAAIERPDAIRFLIYRLADWVPPVREQAATGLLKYKHKRYIDELIFQLTLMEWVQKVMRIDLTGIYAAIVHFICHENRHIVLERFSRYPDKVRLSLAKRLSKAGMDDGSVLSLLLRDRHELIRVLALDHWTALTSDAIEKLLRDKSPAIRLRTLRKLQGSPDFGMRIRDYVADNAASVRLYARFVLRHANLDFATCYHGNLVDNKQVIGSLFGLAEVGGDGYWRITEKYLVDHRAKTVKAALLALKTLNTDKAQQFALDNLDCESRSLYRLVSEILAECPTPQVEERARKLFRSGNIATRKKMLALFSKIGGWRALPDLIWGTVDADDGVRQLSAEYLNVWKVKATNVFTAVNLEELKRAKQALEEASHTLRTKKYFDRNPLDGLTLYLD